MNRSLRLLAAVCLLVGLAAPADAQVVTTDPAFPTVTQPVTVYFHAREGTGGLAGFAGDVYAHTGVITDAGPGWRYVKTNWGQNTADTKLERVGPDEYRLHIEDIRAYYGVPASEKIRQLAFVFRSADASREGKADGGADIFVDLYESGLNVQVAEPVASPLWPFVVDRDTTVRVVVIAASQTSPLARLRLLVDGAEVAQAADDTLTYDLVLDVPGRVDVEAIAENEAGETASATFYAVRNAPVEAAVRPAGTPDGITYDGDTRVTLALFAPYKSFVYVLGDFNGWEVHPDYLMRRDVVNADSAYYWITLDGLEPGREYGFQYLVDGEIRIADPYAEKVLLPEDGGIPSITYPGLKPYPAGQAVGPVGVLQPGRAPYDWQVDDFERPAPERLVIYELLLRDFLSRHDYATLIDTLDYLDRLGINAIELMPVSEFQGNESWGYNPAGFYFAADKYYGPAEDLKRFVDEAHRRGIAVLLDIVLNHSYGGPLVELYFRGGRPAPENPWFNVQHNFANTAAHWGYDFDHESAATQYFVDRVTRYWLEEYRVDGYRFDFTKGFSNNFKPMSDEWGSRYDADRVRLLKRMVDAMWEVAPGSYAIFEHLAENREDQELAEYGILLWGNMNYNYNEATMGYHADGKSDFSWGFHETRGWNVPHLVTYMESHDEERLMFKNLAYGACANYPLGGSGCDTDPGPYNVRDLPVALDRMKLAGAFFFTLPGPKMIWQFGELGYDVSIDFDCRVCNKPIPWQDYWRHPQGEHVLRRKLYQAWAALLRLRNEYEVFTSTETEVSLSVRGTTKRINLTHPSMNVTIVGNFGVRPATVTPNFQSTGTWYDFFLGEAVTVSSLSEPLGLGPGEFHIYTSKPVFTPEAGLITVDAETDAELPGEVALAQNYPNPFNPLTTINYALPQSGPVRLEVFDLLGRRVAMLVDDVQPAGAHTLTFDARGLPSGTYVYRLQAAGRTETRRMVLLK